MQPETAFWILSAMAQSAAALAGLSALLLVFQLRIAAQGWNNLEKERDLTRRAMTAKSWANLIRYSSTATTLFLLAVGFSLAALWGVAPGEPLVGTHIVILTLAAAVLVLTGGLMMLLFVREPRLWILPALDDMAKGMTRRKLRSELKKLLAEDMERGRADREPHSGRGGRG